MRFFRYSAQFQITKLHSAVNYQPALQKWIDKVERLSIALVSDHIVNQDLSDQKDTYSENFVSKFKIHDMHKNILKRKLNVNTETELAEYCLNYHATKVIFSILHAIFDTYCIVL